MKVSFEGMGEQVMTFEAASTVTEGALVKMSGAGKVALCSADGDIPIGVARNVRGGVCAVQTSGYMKAPCVSTLTVGFARLSCDENKKLESSTGGRPGFVLDVDGTAGVCGVLF